jgi:alkyl sulfatase BDS1-like metallo-beta-lactamase superfamily hydrolase
MDEIKTNTKKHKRISEYITPAIQIFREEGMEENKWSSETTEALTFFVKQKRNIKKYVHSRSVFI